MEMNDLRDALVHELKDLFSAEKQLTKALPKMAKKAEDPKLKEAFEHHLKETEGQINRLTEALEHLDSMAGRQKCQAMAGLIEEGEHLIQEDPAADVCDALLIAAAQKVEHYEIASYGTVVTWAKLLNLDSVAQLLAETLDEEESADKKLTAIAKKVNKKPLPA